MPRTRQRTCSLCVTELDHIVGRCCSVNIALVFLAFGFLPTLVARVFVTLVRWGSRLMPCSVFQRKVFAYASGVSVNIAGVGLESRLMPCSASSPLFTASVTLRLFPVSYWL